MGLQGDWQRLKTMGAGGKWGRSGQQGKSHSETAHFWCSHDLITVLRGGML